MKFIFTYVPFAMLIYRAFLFLRSDLIRFKMFRDANSKIAKIAKTQITAHMKHVFISNGKPELAEKLIPDFPVGCKRIGISDDYLPALCAKNVTVNTESIKKVQGRTITTADGTETEVDVLVLATGFNTGGFLGELNLYGRNNVHLNELWETSIPKSFKTVSVHGFPNMFMTLGPFSGLGHNSVVTIIERYGIRCSRKR
jgi:cation diffusion facilitator CzcD-associated flavoprotein CzcO